MADNKTRIVITAEDRASAAIGGVHRAMGNLSAAAGTLAPMLGGLAGALSVGAFVGFARGAINAADDMAKLSQRVGIGVKDLAAWQLAADLGGASIESVAKGVKSLSTFMVEHNDKLRAAGITATDANGALIQLADLFQAMPDGVDKTNLAVKLFGKAGMDLIPVLNQGSAGLQDMQEKSRLYGERLAAMGPDAEKFNDQLTELAFQSKVAGMNIAQYFLPGLAGIATLLNDFAAGGERGTTAMEFISEKTSGFTNLIPQLRIMAELVERIGPALALAGVGGDPSKRLSVGRIAGTGPTLAEEDALAARNLAGMRAAAIVGGSAPAGGKAAKPSRGIDDENDVLFKIQEAVRKQNREADIAAQKAADALDDKARAMDALHMARMETYRIETEGEEAVRLEMEKTGRAIKDTDNFARDFGLTMSSAFEDAIIGGKSLGDVLKGLGDDIARMVLRKSITEPLGNAVSGAVEKSGLMSGIGDFFKGIFNAQGNAFVSEDLARYSNSVVTRPTLFKFAQGIGLMGEKPGSPGEAIMPLSRMSGGDLGVKVQGGGGVVINQTIHIDSRSDQASIMAAMVQAKNAALAEIGNSRRRGGAFA